MKTERLKAGWRVGFIIGGGLARLWLWRWIVTWEAANG
jgi:hypothetical protein